MIKKIDEPREKVRKKYLEDKRYNAPIDDTQQRYSLRNKFGFYFEYRKLKETISLFNYAKINLENMRILDIGCHKGFQLSNLAFLRGSSKDLHGIDFMPSFISQAKAINPSINFKVMDFYALKFKDNYFDLITLYYVINCMPQKDREKIISGISKKLKKGGHILVFEFSDNPIINSIRKITKTLRGTDNSYIEYSNDKIIKKYFTDFRIIKSKNLINFLSYPMSKAFSYPIIELLDFILPNNYYIALLQKIK